MFRWAGKLPDETEPSPRPQDPRVKMIKWFGYSHLPEHLQKVSAHFSGLALWMMDNLDAGPEATEAMRKLLEAKDCGIRAYMETKLASEPAPERPVAD